VPPQALRAHREAQILKAALGRCPTATIAAKAGFEKLVLKSWLRGQQA
jgi:hypothetical protein